MLLRRVSARERPHPPSSCEMAWIATERLGPVDNCGGSFGPELRPHFCLLLRRRANWCHAATMRRPNTPVYSLIRLLPALVEGTCLTVSLVAVGRPGCARPQSPFHAGRPTACARP